MPPSNSRILRSSPAASPETSSRASVISVGSSHSSTLSEPLRWAAVRAPTIGAVTPGRSRTQARATSSGVQPSPSAARETASTMLRLRSVSSGSTKPLRCAEAPRESAGVPLRYLPVRMPRPSGDQGRMPMPQAAAAGTTSASGERLSREYSTWLVASDGPAGHRPLPGGTQGGLPAGPVADADVRRAAAADRDVERAERLLDRRRVGPDVHLPEVEVVDAEALQRGVEALEQVAARGVEDPLLAPDAHAGLGRQHHLVARHDRAEQLADQLLRRAVGVRVGRVEEGAAGVAERDQLVARLVLVGVTPPGHGAETQPRHRQAGVPHATAASWQHGNRQAVQPSIRLAA